MWKTKVNLEIEVIVIHVISILKKSSCIDFGNVKGLMKHGFGC